MFDKFRLKEVLIQYKKDFLPKHWKDENTNGKLLNAFRITGMSKRRISRICSAVLFPRHTTC